VIARTEEQQMNNQAESTKRIAMAVKNFRVMKNYGRDAKSAKFLWKLCYSAAREHYRMGFDRAPD
jgi:hypothetical protein